MTSFLEPSCVEYVCACGILNNIINLYFCRHCLKLRCGFCVSHEVDSHFCSNCLENIPSSEAKHKKNRCNSCFDCPSCHHTLSARATTVTAKKIDDDGKEVEAGKPVSKKMYYLSCLACRWTSRDVGIPDQAVATGQWPEPEYLHATRFAMLMEHFQAVVLHDKQEKQDFLRRKTPKQHSFPSLTDRTGLTVSMIRRQMGWSEKTVIKAKPSNINASIAEEVVSDLPDTIFTEPINLKSITSIKQRLAQPAGQPFEVNKLYPQHKSLSIKHSLRCRQCEHNVIKPEYNPGSIKYRIQLFASCHVPEVRLVSVNALKAGVASSVTLKLINPTINEMTITMMELPTAEEEVLMIQDMKKDFDKHVSLALTPSLTSISRQSSIVEDPRVVDKLLTAYLELPDSSFNINHRDDSAEFDEDVQNHKEDPKFVVWRRANKLALRLNVTPNVGLGEGNDVIIGFSMQYTYFNTVINTPDKKGPQKHALTSRVYINLGKLEA